MISLRTCSVFVGLLAVAALATTAARRTVGDDPQPKAVEVAQAQAPAAGGAEKPFGIQKRTPWTTSKFHGTPEPPLPYRAERVFPNISFRHPTAVANAPGTKRLFVTEQSTGKVFSIPDDQQAKAADPFLDLQESVKLLPAKEKLDVKLAEVYGLAFHPKFAENRYVYVCYTVQPTSGGRGGAQSPTGSRVSRFTVSKTEPPVCDPDSEKLIITYMEGGHNGGCLKFGPEGYLYVSTGDAGNFFPPDGHKTGQDISNLEGSILRIDVDRPTAERPYSIPADNPFATLEGARGEVWCYGLRNPWKMSFDRTKGDLWTGDVGWELWEMIYKVQKGGNYGWSLYEGKQPVHTDRPRGPTPILPPTVEIPHTDGVSVTGGFVYRGKKFPELVGTYLFGDWETRRVWGVSADASEVGPMRDIVDPTIRVVEFAEDNDGELYLVDYDAGTLNALVRNPPPSEQHTFPRKLSETGIFTSPKEHRPAAGVLPFSIIAPLWSDKATGERFLGVPDEGKIRIHSESRSIPGSMFKRAADFPKETVLVKTLSLEMEDGIAASAKRIETQVLHFDGRDWRGYAYEWNDDQTDATLVEREGKSKLLTVRDAAAAGGKRQQTWKFVSRSDCIRCHNQWIEYAIAFTPAQLDRNHKYPDATDNQLRTLEHIGVIEKVAGGTGGRRGNNNNAPAEPAAKLVDPYDASADIEARARAYLHVHCGECHREGGGGTAYIHLNRELTLKATKALGARPAQGAFGIRDGRTIAPGDPIRSVLYFRMAKLGPGHMPYIGSSTVDTRGLEVIYQWISKLPKGEGDPPAFEQPAALARLAAEDPAAPNRAKLIEEMLSSTSNAMMLARGLWQKTVSDSLKPAIVEMALKNPDPVVRDLFESFVPEEQRAKRLGDVVRPDDILKLAGDVERGKELFHRTAGIQCRTCHKVQGEGTEIGPDLSTIGKKYDRAKILENILEPSKNVDPQFLTHIVETKAGKVITGVLVSRDDNVMVLKDAQNQQHKIATADIELAATAQKSLMPDLLVRELTAQQVADLVKYLESMK